jgi:hypothetical protein
MMQHGFLRHGVMAAFESFEHFRSNYEEVISLFRDDCGDSDDELSAKSYENDGSFNFRNLVRQNTHSGNLKTICIIFSCT